MNTSTRISTRSLLLLAVASLLILVMIFLVFIRHNTSFDGWVFSCIDPYRSSRFSAVMKMVTHLGNHNFLIPANLLLITFLVFKKKKGLAITCGMVALSSLLIMIFLKELTHRLRPSDPLIPGITNFSFPSGHAFMSIAFYGLLIWITTRVVAKKWIRRSIILFLLLLILIIGFSRIYLRVHYATDVIAGFCMGTAWLIILLSIIKKQQPKFLKIEK
jgi:membrane-associated phospholipid phosphatase